MPVDMSILILEYILEQFPGSEIFGIAANFIPALYA